MSPQYTDDSWREHSSTYSTLNVKIDRWPPPIYRFDGNLLDSQMTAAYGMSVDVLTAIGKVNRRQSTAYMCGTHSETRTGHT